MSLSPTDPTAFLKDLAASDIRARAQRALMEGQADDVRSKLAAAREAGDQLVIDGITEAVADYADHQKQVPEFNAWCDRNFLIGAACVVLALVAQTGFLLDFIPRKTAYFVIAAAVVAAGLTFLRSPPKRFRRRLT